MIRFCDRDVYCTAVSKCNLSDIICFMNHNKEEIVCFLDDSERFLDMFRIMGLQMSF